MNGAKFLHAHGTNAGIDIEPNELPVALQRLRADIGAGPISIPSIEKFGNGCLGWVNAFAGCVLCDQTGELNLGVALPTLEARISNAALASERVRANVIFELKCSPAAFADVTFHVVCSLWQAGTEPAQSRHRAGTGRCL